MCVIVVACGVCVGVKLVTLSCYGTLYDTCMLCVFAVVVVECALRAHFCFGRLGHVRHSYTITLVCMMGIVCCIHRRVWEPVRNWICGCGLV